MSAGLQVADLDLDGLIAREWIVANGVGGYASSTVAGMNTRRYHGLLVASMAPPVRRMVLLSRIEETVHANGREFYLACNEYPGTIWPRGHEHLRAFSTEPFPRWGYQGDGWTIEKQVRLLRGENTVVVSYTLLGGMTGADIELRPLLALRTIHDLASQHWGVRPQAEARAKGHWRVAATHRTPEVFFAHDGTFDRKPNWYNNTVYRREGERGYYGMEDVWCPGVARIRLVPGQPAYFACSADPFELAHVVSRAGRQVAPGAAAPSRAAATSAPAPTHGGNGNGAAPAAPPQQDADLDALVRAADLFVLSNRQGESSGATVQYHWNPPSPRLALTAFTGLYLVPGRYADARSLLLTLVPRLDNGLLPNEFPEDGSDPVYGGADVSLWFVNAVWQYLKYTGDAATVRRQLLEPVFQILDAYQRGTGLGIHADAEHLLVSRHPHVGTTWMDAKHGDWVITPRGGRAVDLNALWFNAVRAAADLARRFDQPHRADGLTALAGLIHEAFNRRFWNDPVGCCYDVLDDAGPDPTVRPNQLLAVSLPFPVLAEDPVLSEERQVRMLDKVRRELLTPMGVRTLTPKDPGYLGYSGGHALHRDRALHNGSAHPWLLAHYVTAAIRLGSHDRAGRDAAVAEAKALLRPLLDRLRGAGLGQLNELFDGNAPHHPGGAIASPLSVGELLRCYAEDVLGLEPARPAASTAGEPAPQSAPSDAAVRPPA